ncbi:hypothetical protein BC826DRAFT_630875 [Russula brevipes]|nr:hypothetical protein BC826DRAFT_630875 [Russula brevipes]
MSPSSSTSVPDNHVWLVLIYESDLPSSFYLQIPLEVIHSLCLRPRKYLLYLGWCVLGIEGVLAVEPNGNEIVNEGGLNNQGVYYFVTPEDANLSQAVDLEVIMTEIQASSESVDLCEKICAQLLERDICCIWTGGTEEIVDAVHIIPFQRSSDWIEIIVRGRSQYDEDIANLDDIDDVRNGMVTNPQIHRLFDRRTVVVLKTPNPILGKDDIPQCLDREYMPEGAVYPANERYTLQSLETLPPDVSVFVPVNRDGAFRGSSDEEKPSGLLLHYNYGAAAVKVWGHGKEVLEAQRQPLRPPPRQPAPVRYGRAGRNDRSIAIEKRKRQQSGGRGAPRAGLVMRRRPEQGP